MRHPEAHDSTGLDDRHLESLRITMVDSALRRRGEIQRSIFRVLLSEPSGLSAAEVLARAEKILPPDAFEDQDYVHKPGVRRYTKKQRFASIALVKAGRLLKNDGVWALTEAGRAAYEQFSEPEVFERQARLMYQQWAATRPSGQFDPREDAEDAEAAQLEKSAQQRRAWLVRGANVEKVNALPQWFADRFCSIGWTELGDIPAGKPRPEIAEMVQKAFPDATVEAEGSW